MGESIKNYRLKEGESRGHPHLLCEVKLDLHDVRSGYNATDLLLVAGPWIKDETLHWTPDMVRKLKWRQIEEWPQAPALEISQISQVEDKVTRYLLDNYKVSIWKNYELGLYSLPAESREDFVSRCSEVLAEARNQSLRKIKDVFLHRFFELEQRATEGAESDDDQRSVQKTAEIRNLFSAVRDALSRCFLREDFTPLAEGDLAWKGNLQVEFQERLDDLRAEFIIQYNAINQECRQTANRVESYSVPVRFSEMGIVFEGILWC